MIGIHLDGEVFWFDFPHTLENQDMLIRRLEREALNSGTPAAMRVRMRRANRHIEAALFKLGEERYKLSIDLIKRFAEIGRAFNKIPPPMPEIRRSGKDTPARPFIEKTKRIWEGRKP